MDFDYYEVTSELDPREILRYLNHLGIHNISGEVLKYFITDLKKLIKHDLDQRSKSSEQEYEIQGPERLHSASTFSSRIRSKTYSEDSLKCGKECRRTRKPLAMRNIHSAPVLGRQKTQEEKPVRRACSCNAVERKVETVSRESRVTTTTSNNLIKVPKPPVKKKCDPVSLYHYYTSLWAKYKPNVPGENDWADLRWHIRQKMAGSVSHHSDNKAPESHVKVKERTHAKK
ncbi:uncharacterized protein LOC126368089 [Pectinophora gossypiella]|uniref:Centriolar and ciliogenesis-associated protein HYLS1 C-terminal domain-containing protein n=1 Tax=Pectinophora gossypiella TaxID=13191 RepID=A0A1E1W061_PECGO|nr:uncharacterized protein LOC126368089 [Pectinophora gossypiella]